MSPATRDVLDLSLGGALGAALFGTCTFLALRPLRAPRPAAVATWMMTAAVCEVPLLFLAVIVISTVPPALEGVQWPGGWFALAIAAATSAGLLVVAARARSARPVLERMLDDAVGSGWREAAAGGLPHRSLWRTGLWPWPVRPGRIECLRNLSYGPRDPGNLCDLYRHRSARDVLPVLVHLHGGGFRWGSKSREARALLHHLCDLGWTCISANYSPAASRGVVPFDSLIDVKRLLTWLHDHGRSYGADPDRVVLTGSSAGAHLTAMAAVTVGDRQLQPGFEDGDTSFVAGVGFYGYYGELSTTARDCPSAGGHDGSHVPPMLVIHGGQDTCTPVEGARAFVEHLRRDGTPAWLAEVPAAQHSFDALRSFRYMTIVDAVAVFASHAVGHSAPTAWDRWPADGASPSPPPRSSGRFAQRRRWVGRRGWSSWATTRRTSSTGPPICSGTSDTQRRLASRPDGHPTT